MAIDELGDKLMDKSSEVYWEHCSEEAQDEDSQLAVKYWCGWSDALEWLAQLISDNCLEYLELERPIPIGERNAGGSREVFYKYPPDWSDEQKEEWRKAHGA